MYQVARIFHWSIDNEIQFYLGSIIVFKIFADLTYSFEGDTMTKNNISIFKCRCDEI